jgi:N-acylneuraminate cytidylyltransferase
MSNLAIIPARGKSKRIPGKNIRSFLGNPIIHYSIEAALQSDLFDEVMVSTEDEEIAEVSRQAGASLPFFRSTEKADDYSPTGKVIEEVLSTYRQKFNKVFSTACCIYPTAPFVTAEKLQRGYKLLQESDFEAVLTIVPFQYPVQRGVTVDNNGKVQLVWPENIEKRSQELETIYHDAGQFYWFKTNAFLETKRFLKMNAGSIILTPMEVQDIDEESDWQLAEIKYEYFRQKSL